MTILYYLLLGGLWCWLLLSTHLDNSSLFAFVIITNCYNILYCKLCPVSKPSNSMHQCLYIAPCNYQLITQGTTSYTGVTNIWKTCWSSSSGRGLLVSYLLSTVQIVFKNKKIINAKIVFWPMLTFCYRFFFYRCFVDFFNTRPDNGVCITFNPPLPSYITIFFLFRTTFLILNLMNLL